MCARACVRYMCTDICAGKVAAVAYIEAAQDLAPGASHASAKAAARTAAADKKCVATRARTTCNNARAQSHARMDRRVDALVAEGGDAEVAGREADC